MLPTNCTSDEHHSDIYTIILKPDFLFNALQVPWAGNCPQSGRDCHLVSAVRSKLCNIIDSHVVVVSSDGERETAMNLCTISTSRRTPQCTTRKHSLLLLIEANRAEFLPVTDQLVLDNNLMDCKLALFTVRGLQ